LADPERGCVHPRERKGTLSATNGLALLGRVARLLNAGGESDETLAAVAELLHTAVPAERVVIWFRDRETSGFASVAAPVVEKLPLIESLDKIPTDGPSVRIPLEHEEALIGLLEARPELSGGQREVLAVVAELVAPFLASRALSSDLAIEVAADLEPAARDRRTRITA
jgi:GAF domain-containing protein